MPKKVKYEITKKGLDYLRKNKPIYCLLCGRKIRRKKTLKSILKKSGLYTFANSNFTTEQVDCEVEALISDIKKLMLEKIGEDRPCKYGQFSAILYPPEMTDMPEIVAIGYNQRGIEFSKAISEA